MDMEGFKADAVIMPGHKGIMGPQGIGIVLLSDSMAEKMNPIILGGTEAIPTVKECLISCRISFNQELLTSRV